MSAAVSFALPQGQAMPRPVADAAGWAALDEPAAWSAFSRPLPQQAGTWESYLAIDGMHCAACTLAVEQALAGAPGVRSVQVNGASRTARVVWSEGAGRPSLWQDALRRAGYAAMPASDLLEARPRVHAARVLLWRWMVAGFAMMQAMMYSVPLYVAGPGEITPDIESLLRWGAWMMTLPVVLFSCWPFFATAWRDLRRGRLGMDVPVALGLLIAFGASTAATFDPSGPWGREVWYDSVTMFVFFLLSGRLLEQRLRDRTAGALDALMRSLPASIERLGPNGFERVAVRRLVVGDRVRVLPGEAFPGDGSIEAGESRVDEALLTGESRPLARRAGDPVIAGSHNLDGTLTVRIERLGADTRFAAIVALMERASVDKPRLAQMADRIASPFLLVILASAVAAAAAWWPTGPAHALSVAVAVLIVTCPCALSLATPAATLAAAGALARRGVLVRQLQTMEAAATIDTVVFDKTGTLTLDRMTLGQTRCRSGITPDQALLAAASLAAHSLHPLSRALADAAQGVTQPLAAGVGAGALPCPSPTLAGPSSAAARSVREIPGQGLRGEITSGPWAGQVLRLGSAVFCEAPEAAGADVEVHLADESGWIASFVLHERLRDDAVTAIAQLRAQGLQVRLLSGDRPEAVAALAARAGIGLWQAGCLPEAKLDALRDLQAAGRQVLMVGDGVNDAPVLALADVSVAMGEGVPLAQARADVVAQGGRLQAVPTLLAQARRTRRVVRENLAWAALYNALCIPLAAAGLMPPWLAGLGMAASSLLVVANSARLAALASSSSSSG